MKKFIYSIFFVSIFLLISAVLYLSTIGLTTSKFNDLIINKVEKKDTRIKLELKKIKIKLDLRKVQLFLSTIDPKIKYQNLNIPVTEIKIYTKFKRFLNSNIYVERVVFSIEKLKIQDIQKIAIRVKPSNFKTYLLNNLDNGELKKASFDLDLDEDFRVIDFKVNGTIKKTNAKIKNNFIIKDISFNFIIDRKLTLINSISGNREGISISNGSVELSRQQSIKIKGKFNTKFNLKENELRKIFKNEKFFEKNKVETQGILLHEFNLKIDNSLKVLDYEYKSTGNIPKSHLILKNELVSDYIENPIKKIFFKKTKAEIHLSKKNKKLLLLEGMYSTNGSSYNKFKIQNNLNKKKQNYLIDLNLSENFFFDIINFRSNSKKISNIKSNFSIGNKKLYFKSIDFKEGKNLISVKDLVINKKNEIEKISYVNLLTFDNNIENNNFKISIGKKISIFGTRYDSTFLLKLLSSNNKLKIFKNFNNNLEVKLKNIRTKSGTTLKNFNLIGTIKKGTFHKISAKSEFSKDEFLDINLRKDPNGKKIIEVYSDLPQALLADSKFFDGIRGGKLLYKSVIDESGSASKLIIENFKVTKAPAFATLLTLADLSGYADVLSGQGMSFDILEIKTKDNFSLVTIEEILALGTSISLQMDGYIEKKTGLVSLSGTLIPAKTLNRLVSKIPVVGNILIGSKVGEGVFGVSFKIKGLPKKIKTTINPVKTLTPRFITRALEKMKKNN